MRSGSVKFPPEPVYLRLKVKILKKYKIKDRGGASDIIFVVVAPFPESK